jgi:hypothetical protein
VSLGAAAQAPRDQQSHDQIFNRMSRLLDQRHLPDLVEVTGFQVVEVNT